MWRQRCDIILRYVIVILEIPPSDIFGLLLTLCSTKYVMIQDFINSGEKYLEIPWERRWEPSRFLFLALRFLSYSWYKRPRSQIPWEESLKFLQHGQLSKTYFATDCNSGSFNRRNMDLHKEIRSKNLETEFPVVFSRRPITRFWK